MRTVVLGIGERHAAPEGQDAGRKDQVFHWLVSLFGLEGWSAQAAWLWLRNCRRRSDFGGAEQLLGRAFFFDEALVEEDDAVRQVAGHAHVMGHEIMVRPSSARPG
jgi:hypothetical protein